MLCFISRKVKTTEMEKKKIIAYGEGAVVESVKSGLWLHAGDFSLSDALHSGSPVEVNNDQIKTLRTVCVTPFWRQLTYSK